MKINAIIPARGGSKGIPKKNLAKIGGHPLIAYAITACRLAKSIDRVIVSTDSEEIAAVAKFYGAEIPFMRPQELARDNSTDVGFLKHYWQYTFAGEEVALMRPTTPFRDPNFIDYVVAEYFKHQDNISGLRSLNEINESPYKVYKVEENICKGFFDNFEGIANYSNLPRQIFPKTYQANGHIDIVKRKTLFEKNEAFGDKIYAIIGERVIDIDSRFDLEIAQYQAGTDKDLILPHINQGDNSE